MDSKKGVWLFQGGVADGKVVQAEHNQPVQVASFSGERYALHHSFIDDAGICVSVLVPESQKKGPNTPRMA